MIEQVTVLVSDTEVVNSVISDRDVVHSVVGIQGPAGPSIESYTHTQTQLSETWIVNHNLGRYPTVNVLTTGLQYMIATIQHINSNQVRIYFNEPQQGLVICK